MKCQREKFNLQRKYAYLDCAYMSPLLKKVENAGIKGIKRKRKPFHITPADFFEEANTIRQLYARLIDTPEPDRIVLIPSVSYGIANVVRNLPFNSGKILITDGQFPSNVYPWQSLNRNRFVVEIIKAPASENRGANWNEELLDSIDEETRVVALGHIHWSDGTLFELKKIRSRLNEVGGLLIVDGTQSVGALPFSVKEIRPDALICGAYKWLMGPYSIGLAYYGKVFDEGKPIEESWLNRSNSEDFTKLANYQPKYQSGSLRYEVGEHGNFILVPMLHAAIKQLLRWTPEGIQNYCDTLMENAISKLQCLGYLIQNKNHRANHLFGIRHPEAALLEALKKSFKKNRVSVSFRGEVIRISPHVYNDELDVKKLLKAMKEPIFASKN
ncbi:MAG: aminotransferase class V-fold PLP-dependent enzyme [Ekhidna sp.]|nr:aminotransferase class V-fold PLP-dependent enzyme [Ekhidna sp.]